MFTTLLGLKHKPNEQEHREGDLYRVVTTFGKTFELRYGYYGENDGENPLYVIYPDFLEQPHYTDRGEPFVTVLQDACENYRGESEKTADTTCEGCEYFRGGEDWFGICTSPGNKRALEGKEAVQNE